MGCQEMKPVVHGLERRYKGRLDVLYFDISDAKYADVQRKLKFRSTPHLILLTKDGNRVTEWMGVTPQATLAASIDKLLSARR